MARSRMSRPEPIRLALSDGDYIDVKKALSAGEREDMLGEIAPTVEAGAKFNMNTKSVRTATIAAYLLGWSFVDDSGKPIPMSPDLPAGVIRSTIRGLDTATFDELFDAITYHEKAQSKVSADEKNDRAGAIVSASISPSVN